MSGAPRIAATMPEPQTEMNRRKSAQIRPVDWKTLIDDRALRLWQAGAATKGQP